MQITRYITVGILAVAALGAAIPSTAFADSGLERIKQAGVVKLGIAPEPPYAVMGADGNVSGADPEIAKEVFEKLGISKLSASVVDWGALIPGLMASRFDIVATGLFVRPERCKAVLFSQPLLCTSEGFLVKKGNPLGLHSYQDILEKKAKLSAVGGGAEERRALSIGVSRENVLGVSDIFNAAELLKSGRVDALGFPDITLNAILDRVGASEFEIVTELPGEPIQCAAAAFKPQDRDLRDQFDEEVEKLKQSGRFAEILKANKFDPMLVSKTNRDTLCEAKN